MCIYNMCIYIYVHNTSPYMCARTLLCDWGVDIYPVATLTPTSPYLLGECM